MRSSILPFITSVAVASLFGAESSTPPDQLLLQGYRTRSIYQIPQTRVEKALYRAIDVHSHNNARSDEAVAQWVRTMDDVGVEKTIILSGATGQRFDEILAKYGKYPDRFE